MKQIYLRPRGGGRSSLRSDTLFGLITWGVREVYGAASVERFLAPIRREPPEAPLTITSAFPFIENSGERVHFFPRPLGEGCADPGSRSRWIEDRELLAFVTGHPLAEEPRDGARSSAPFTAGGCFFLASGPSEHYLEAALGFLERFGFGGGGSHGQGAFDVELRDAEFLRLSHPGELSLLLSLYSPAAAERERIVARAREPESPVRYGVERRQGVAGGRLGGFQKPFKRAVAMMTEGSVLPCGGTGSCGQTTEVGRSSEDGGGHLLLQHGFGFFVPIAGATQ
ncbi:MAG: hypothetical protein V2A76_15140 [Planctomycetota bacterium]